MKRHKKKYLFSFPFRFVFLSILVLSIVSLLLFYKNNTYSKKTSPIDFSAYAARIFQQCQNKTYKDICYNQYIIKLMDPPHNLSMEDAFEVTKIVQKKDITYMNCHVLAHSISGKETRKDPSKWKDIITRCPTTMCNNGCSHGVLLERYKAQSLTDEQIEALKPELASVCLPRNNWHPEKVEISMCHHGLGHLAMYITHADVPKSLALCQHIGKKATGEDYTQTCIEAVFMQIFQPLEEEDRALVNTIAPAKNRESVNAFCHSYTNDAYHACHRESWAYFWKEIHTPKGLTTHCAYTTDVTQQEKCYAALMNTVTNQFALRENNMNTLRNFCMELSQPYQGMCFAHAARRLLQIDPKLMEKALRVCMYAKEASEESEQACYDMLSYYGKWIYSPHTQAYTDYCQQLPPAWQHTCFSFTQ